MKMEGKNLHFVPKSKPRNTDQIPPIIKLKLA